MCGIYVNHWAVLIAGVAGTLIGTLWYSPVVFGKVWMKLLGISGPKSVARSYILGLISTIVLGYALAVVVALAGAAGVFSGALVGVLAWFGFAATVGLAPVLWEGRPFTVYLIDMGYYLIIFAVMGAIVAFGV
jgi:hypothetical protein